MSIKKQYLKSKDVCKVTFAVPPSESDGVEKVYVVGDFNNWSTSATPMKRFKNGVFKVSLDLEKGREYQFRYLYDGRHWENDTEADKSVETPFGDARNSVIAV